MRKRFAKLLGNSDTRLRLSNAILEKTLPHALLIVGPRGSGKHTLALEIAAAANCENRDNENFSLPCGTCSSCKRIYDGNFPDISYLEKSSGKATIGVEELREFREDMFLSSTEAAYKFYIIENADIMTPAAQNALLKVLEEPPKNVHIILLASEADKLLSTVKSRTQYIQMEIFEYEELKEYTTELSDMADALSASSPDRLKAILLSSGGVIGKALSMIDEGQIEALEVRRAIVKNFIAATHRKAPFSSLYSATMALPQKRDELKETLEEIRNAIRDMVALRLSDNIAPTYFLIREDAEEAASSLSAKRLMHIYDIIGSAIEDIDKNIVISTLLTDIAVRIKV